MNKEELEILKQTLALADGYFTGYCEFTDSYVPSEADIEQMDDESEREQAQELLDYDTLLRKAQEIVDKYNKPSILNKTLYLEDTSGDTMMIIQISEQGTITRMDNCKIINQENNEIRIQQIREVK